jgi:hypothetical protein
MQDATIKKKVLTNIQIYWDVMPLGLVNGYWYFEKSTVTSFSGSNSPHFLQMLQAWELYTYGLLCSE